MTYRNATASRAGLGLFFLSLTAGCGNAISTREAQVFCTTEAVAGLDINLRDSRGYPISDATLVATDGDYSEQLLLQGHGQYMGAFERVGSYSLLISIPGMSDTEIGPIDVRPDGACHVRTETRYLEFWP